MRHHLSLELSRLSRPMRAGLLVFAAGAALDLLYHAAPSQWAAALDTYLGRDGFVPHLVTLLGMIATMAAVLAEQIQPLAAGLRQRLGWSNAAQRR